MIETLDFNIMITYVKNENQIFEDFKFQQRGNIMKIVIFRVFCNFLAFTAFQKKWGKCNFRQNPNLFQCISSLFWWVYLKNGSLFISGLRDISHHTLVKILEAPKLPKAANKPRAKDQGIEGTNSFFGNGAFWAAAPKGQCPVGRV